MSFSGVLDSSVGIAWVHPAQASPATDAILHRADAGETFAVPVLWFTEMANGILVLQRRNKISPAARIAALDRLLKLNLHIDIPSPALAFTDYLRSPHVMASPSTMRPTWKPPSACRLPSLHAISRWPRQRASLVSRCCFDVHPRSAPAYNPCPPANLAASANPAQRNRNNFSARCSIIPPSVS